AKQSTRSVNNKANLDFVKSYQPRNKEVKHLRILLHGPVGAGKSSFINSVDSVLQGRVTARVMTDAISGTSFTRKYASYKIRKEPMGHYSFIFNDIMGYEQHTNRGVHVEDVKMALRGHVKKHYEFIPGRPLKEGDLDYNSSPTLDDRVHVLVCAIPAASVSIISDDVVKKMREVRLAASDAGIPQLVIITKVDEACDEVRKDIKNVYKSIYLKEQVDKIHNLLGIPLNSIFLVKNYCSEINVNDDVSALTLCTFKLLRQMFFIVEVLRM
uniref:G domain-containing protein n=1 Tax=Seriola dumerili TaxID=41447 RepID=A0A3B4T739_SERDU